MFTEECVHCGYRHPLKEKMVEVDIVALHHSVKKAIADFTWFMDVAGRSQSMRRWNFLKRIDQIFKEAGERDD